MESTVESVAAYATALVVERWPELVIGLIVLALWRWLMGHKLRARIAALEARAAAPSILLEKGATYNLIEGDHHVHYHINGPSQIIQPKPTVGKAIPLKVNFAEGVAVGEAFQAKLVHRKARDG